MVSPELVRIVQTPTGYAVELAVELASTRTIEEAEAIRGEVLAVHAVKPVSTGGRVLRINAYPEIKKLGAVYGDEIECLMWRKI